MKGYLFFALLALSCAFNVSAQALYALTEPHPDQTGFYQITSEGELQPATGATIQVFARGERILQDGTTLSLPYIFGAVYEADGTWFTFQGAVHPFSVFNEVDVVIAVVVQDDEGNPMVALLSAGELRFDPTFDGNAHAFFLQFEVEDVVRSFHLVAQSDKTVVGCRIVNSFSPPDTTLYPCRPAE